MNTDKLAKKIAAYIDACGLHSGLDYSEEIGYSQCLDMANKILDIIKCNKD